MLLSLLLYCACNKITNITNNLPPNHRPAFTIQGLGDTSLSLKNRDCSVSFAVQFEDSVQERVSLSLSAMPAGIKAAKGWVNAGYATFNSQILFYENDSLHPAAPGTYPVTLTATGATTGTKTFSFNLTVKNDDLCTGAFTGAYTSCSNTVTGVSFYDSIYNDPQVNNIVWFSNFANSGKAVMGIFDCQLGAINIPYQVIDSIPLSGTASSFSVTLPYKLLLNAVVSGHRLSIKM